MLSLSTYFPLFRKIFVYVPYMISIVVFAYVVPVSAQISQASPEEVQRPKHLTFQAVPFTSVHFTDHFWSPRFKTNRDISIPHNFRWCEETGRFTNFAKAGKLQSGEFLGRYYNDSDVYKLLEGTAYALADHPDAALEKKADDVIAWIAAAQESNGYLNSYHTLKEPDKKWTNTKRMHELYCAGHLIEAAVAYKRATGKETLLHVAERFIDHIIDTFGYEPGKKIEVPGHEEIELALIKLYQLTGKKKYLELSKFFVEVRGNEQVRTDTLQGPYSQDHLPIAEQHEIVGHAVRAVYLYAGVADVAAYTGDQKLIAAMDRLWNDVVHKKMYITGGIGARHQGEAFGEAFELPNRTAYCETCAAIGLVFWAHRLNLMHGAAQYADVMERAIYNGVLSGIGMDGKSFFYVNPLESVGDHHRQPFFDCACCPTNVVRFVSSLPGYQYAIDEEGVVVNLYIEGTATIKLPDGEVRVTQTTNYPWEGTHVLRFEPRKNPGSAASRYRIKYRLPGHDRYDSEWVSWDKAHTLTYSHTMSPERIVANPQVVADRGRVAIQRGPLVYCFEQIDNEVPVNRILLAREPEFKEEFRNDLLGGITILRCKNADGRELTAIPYYAWDHRKPGPMVLWVRQQGLTKQPVLDDPAWSNATTGEPILYRTLNSSMLQTGDSSDEPETIITASHCWEKDSLDAACDKLEPKRSSDGTIPRLTFWPHRGTTEWVELDFETPQKFSQSSVYWFDDTGKGGCRIPASWKLSYWDDDSATWKPVQTADKFELATDRYNTVRFEAIESKRLRLDLTLQKGFSGGILEWKTD